MENIEATLIRDPSEKTAIHSRLLSAVPIDMLELINQLDAEHDSSGKEKDIEQFYLFLGKPSDNESMSIKSHVYGILQSYFRLPNQYALAILLINAQKRQ